jgi:FkbM family methyltransferase
MNSSDQIHGETFKEAARNRLQESPLFFPLRRLYRSLFSREQLAAHRAMSMFYGRFIGKGDLVFDIGAALGEYAEVYCGLGAHVVAVEPNPDRCRRLRRLARHLRMNVEEAAIGAQLGTAKLQLCDEANFSTLEPRWKDRAAESGSGVKWVGEIEVKVTTVAELAKRYGFPSFVKIDVEGFEEQVLDGLGCQPQALSFEFSLYVREAAYRCLAKPALAEYEFNAMLGRSFELVHDRWLSANQIAQWIESMPNTENEYGDLIARRSDSVG